MEEKLTKKEIARLKKIKEKAIKRQELIKK